MSMTLYGYWRSSAAYRVRIALNLKELDAAHVPVHLVRDGGENLKPDYLRLNPAGKVPTLEIDTAALGQSLAIIEYLDETRGDPPLLPRDPMLRARVRAFAYTIACDIHPINNIKVLNYLRAHASFGNDEIKDWMGAWIGGGFAALEETLEREEQAGPFAFGDSVTLAEICLVPQVYNARRFGFDMAPFPRLSAIDDAARALPAFEKAAPDNQPDAE